MKNLIFIALAAVSLFLFSCGGEDCIECTGMDPFFGLTINTEACDNGDGTITVSGFGVDTTYESTLAAYEQENSILVESSCE